MPCIQRNFNLEALLLAVVDKSVVKIVLMYVFVG